MKSLKLYSARLDPWDTGSLGGTRTSDLLRGFVVGSGVTEATSAVALLSDNCTCTLPGTEATAARIAVIITSTRTCDKLSAWGLARAAVRGRGGGRSRGGSSSSPSSTTNVESLTNLEVGAASVDLGVGGNDGSGSGATGRSDSSASITGLDGDGSSSSSTSSGGSSWGSLSWSGDTGSAGSIRALDGDRSAVVGDGLSEAAASVTSLSDDGAGAFARCEGTAVRDAIEIL